MNPPAGSKIRARHKWLAAIWVGLSAVILGGAYLAGPFIAVSILFVIPVALAARFSGRGWGMALGALMPGVHLGFTFLWRTPWSWEDSVVSTAIRMGVLVTFAFLIDRITRQSRELRVLRGLLPVCSFCKKIRTEDQKWQPIEYYITERSEASFTHTFCPECAKTHYGEYFDQYDATQRQAARDPQKPAG